MLSLYDRASMQAALNLALDPKLHHLLAERIDNLVTPFGDLTDWTHFLIVQPGDTEADIVREIGFSPLEDPLSGARYGQAEFTPTWDWLQDHGGWFELVTTCGNSAFAYVFLVEDRLGVPSDLLAMCQGATR